VWGEEGGELVACGRVVGLVCAWGAFVGGEYVAEFVFGLGVVALFAEHPGDPVPGGPRIGVVGAEGPCLGGEDVAVFVFGFCGLASEFESDGDLRSQVQDCGMISAQPGAVYARADSARSCDAG
jgi:hypothetical protein